MCDQDTLIVQSPKKRSARFKVVKLQSSHYVKNPLKDHKQAPLYTKFSCG